MKILFLLPRFHTNIFYAVQALQDHGHSVQIFAAKKLDSEDHQFLVPDILSDSDLSWKGIFRRLQQDRPDVIVIREHGGKWSRFMWAAKYMRIKQAGYDLKPYRDPRGLIKRLTQWLQGMPMRRFSPVRGLGTDQSKDRDFYLPFPVAVPTGKRHYAPGGITRILCVGKLKQARKCHGLLLDVLEKLPGDLPFTLTLIGSLNSKIGGGDDSYYTGLVQRIRSGPLATRIMVLEDQAFATMPELFRAHDICVLPARKEPLGSSPIEGMAHGCVPVISSECGSASTIIDGENGFVFPVDDAVALKAIIEKLIGDHTLLAKVGIAAQDYAGSEFSGATFVQRFEDMVDKL